MRVENYLSFLNTGAGAVRHALSAGKLVPMRNGRAEGSSPLESARQALVNAKSKLEQQRDERIESALEGYKALRSRKTSYEAQLGAQRGQLENFQTLSSRYDALSEELSSARSDYEAYAPDGSALDPAQQRLSMRVARLEQELAAADQDISAAVEQANRYANSQRQYAAYLEKTGQGGYAAFQYQGQPEYTRENFASETAGMIDRLEAGDDQWGERISAYCKQYGLTANDFEGYMRERHKLNDAYFAAQQRFLELLHGAEEPVEQVEYGPLPARKNFDTLEISGGAPGRAPQIDPFAAAGKEAETDSE